MLDRPLLLFVVAILFADVVAAGSAVERAFPAPELLIFYGLAFGQVSLSAIVCGLGDAPRSIRLLAIAATLVVGTLLLNSVRPMGMVWTGVLAIQVTAVGGPLLIVRRRGARWSRPTLDSKQAPPAPLQFTLKHLMLCVTIIAVLLAILRLINFAAPVRVSRLWHEAPVLGSSFALVALAAAWLGLGSGPLILRGTVCFSLAGVVGYGLAKFTGGSEQVFGVMAIVLLQAAFLAGSLWVLRRCGYRLTWRGRNG